MDSNSLIQLAESYLLVLIPLVLGLTQIAKQVIPEKITVKWTPVISLVFGIAGSMVMVGPSKQGILVGLIIGLSASGLWSTATNPFKKAQP